MKFQCIKVLNRAKVPSRWRIIKIKPEKQPAAFTNVSIVSKQFVAQFQSIFNAISEQDWSGIERILNLIF